MRGYTNAQFIGGSRLSRAVTLPARRLRLAGPISVATPAERSLSGNYYATEAKEVAMQVAEAARRAAERAREAFRNAQKS